MHGNSATIQSFNSTFTKYEGTQTGATLSNLSQEVRIVNAQNQGDTARQITLKLPSGVASSALLNKTTNYTVTLGYDTAGYVTSVTVQ